MSESAHLDCDHCGRAPAIEGTNPYQVAINHAAATGHTVTLTRVDVISPEGNDQ